MNRETMNAAARDEMAATVGMEGIEFAANLLRVSGHEAVELLFSCHWLWVISFTRKIKGIHHVYFPILKSFDSNSSIIFINLSLMNHLLERKVYVIIQFDVGQINDTYKTTLLQFKTNFQFSTISFLWIIFLQEVGAWVDRRKRYDY